MCKGWIFTLGVIVLATSSCRKYDNDEVQIPTFNFPQTVSFESNLSAYDIFQGNPADLLPNDEYELLQLSSALFTDYAHKQRLVKVPNGEAITKNNDGSLSFPDGTILTKTFYYNHDDRDTNKGRRIIETRLLIKEVGKWNAATYLWNEAQTDATLNVEGHDTQVDWIDDRGTNRSTVYHVPTQNECMTCHQSNSAMTPLGPTLLNLNRTVNRNGSDVNQIAHLQYKGVLHDFALENIPKMVDYEDESASLADRGRAYLAINCAHCHNPNGWEIPADQALDLRYEIALDQTGILDDTKEITRNLMNQEMPMIGTTMLDEEGVALVIEYLEGL